LIFILKDRKGNVPEKNAVKYLKLYLATQKFIVAKVVPVK